MPESLLVADGLPAVLRQRFTIRSACRCLRHAMLMAVVGWFALLSPHPAAAQTPDVVLGVLPATIELPPSARATALVQVHNGGSNAMNDLHLSAYSNLQGTNISLGNSDLVQLPPGGEHAWPVNIDAPHEMFRDGAAIFRLDYNQGDSTHGGTVPHVSTATARLIPVTATPAEEVLALDIQSVNDSVNEQRPGTLYLVVHNLWNRSIHVEGAHVAGPPFLRLQTMLSPSSLQSRSSSPSHAGFDLGPYASRAITVTVSARDVVQPGEHLLVFEVPVAWHDAAGAHRAAVVATHTVKVGVFAESEMLLALALPSFLFLPGLLILVAMEFVWGAGRANDEKSRYPLRLSAREFAVMSIFISILAALAYPPLSKRLGGEERNYLYGYGLTDVIRIWTLALAAGMVLGLALRCGPGAVRRLTTQVQRRLLPAEGDEPLAVLRKLGRLGRKLVHDVADMKMGDQPPVRVLVLDTASDGTAALMVSPEIILTWSDGNHYDIQGAVEREMVPTGSPKRLAQLLEQCERQGVMRVAWDPSSHLRSPHRAARTHLEFTGERALLVRHGT